MSFRSLVINNRCKLEYSLNYLAVNKGEETKRVLLDEVKMIIINSTQVSITSALISECINKKIKILFGDVKHNLVGEITPYKNNYYANKKIKEQISFEEERKNLLWQQIVKMKIKGQADNLKFIGKSDVADLLYSYSNEVELGDVTNREGLAAKLYFRAAFGKDFYRDDDSIEANTYLNYGYTIILSSFNRSIKALGYYTELGIHHIGETNSFNFSCDLMEPLRPLVDLIILKKEINMENFKQEFINMLSKVVIFEESSTYLDNAIEEYVSNCLQYLKTGNESKIQFINYGIE